MAYKKVKVTGAYLDDGTFKINLGSCNKLQTNYSVNADNLKNIKKDTLHILSRMYKFLENEGLKPIEGKLEIKVEDLNKKNVENGIKQNMKSDEICNKNNAIQGLVEKIIDITHAVIENKKEEIDKQLIFYKDLKNFVKKNYKIDTKPYDIVVKKLTSTTNSD